MTEKFKFLRLYLLEASGLCSSGGANALQPQAAPESEVTMVNQSKGDL
jgi:hypothetical protein